jgi:hypothetical protein
MNLEEKILKLRKDNDSDWHKPRVGNYHASGIYDICEGKMTPDRFLEKPEFDDRLLIIFEIGHMYHGYVQSLFPEAEKEKQIKIERDDWKIVGRADMVLDGKLIELKTCSRLPDEPYFSHQFQVQCYMEALNLDKAYVTYIEKNPKGFYTRDFVVERDSKVMEYITEKVGEFHKELKKINEKI